MDTEDELDHLSNVCADLVSLKRLEPALVHLFRERPVGTWVPVRELYESAGTADDIPGSVSAAWLPSPGGNFDYAVVSFYDDDLKWSMSAVYNVARLVRAPHPTAAAVTT
ncbi:MAG: hypothetical protein ABGY75_15915 [Gemmataceae bacterium]